MTAALWLPRAACLVVLARFAWAPSLACALALACALGALLVSEALESREADKQRAHELALASLEPAQEARVSALATSLAETQAQVATLAARQALGG